MLVVSAAFCSCSSTTNVTRIDLQPQTGSEVWQEGKQILCDSLYGIRYEIAFDRMVGDLYVFDFNIVNGSNMPILIDPVQYYYSCMTDSVKADERIPAIDPDTELDRIRQEITLRESRRKKFFLASLAVSVADFATAVIVSNDRNRDNDIVQAMVAAGAHTALAASAIQNDLETEELYQEQEKWLSGVIRKTTLHTNEALSGKVLFPGSPHAGFLRLHVPVDDAQLAFDYQQLRVR